MVLVKKLSLEYRKYFEKLSQNDSPVIVYGPPRSGTTYLVEILNQHPRVFISNEYRIFSWLHQATHELTKNDQMVANEKQDFQQMLDERLPTLIKDFYVKKHPEAYYWGDKNPFYGNEPDRLRTIAEYWPNAKFINIVRDGRDVVTSLMNKKWPNGRPWADFDHAHDVWNTNVEGGLSFAKESGENHYFIRYEDLIKNDLSEAKKIFNFLDIPWHSAVEEYCARQAKKRTMVSGPVRKIKKDASISMWTDTLNKKQQKDSLKLLRINLENLGYNI